METCAWCLVQENVRESKWGNQEKRGSFTTKANGSDSQRPLLRAATQHCADLNGCTNDPKSEWLWLPQNQVLSYKKLGLWIKGEKQKAGTRANQKPRLGFSRSKAVSRLQTKAGGGGGGKANPHPNSKPLIWEAENKHKLHQKKKTRNSACSGWGI